MKQVRLLSDGVVAEIIEAPELLPGAVAVKPDVFEKLLSAGVPVKLTDGKIIKAAVRNA